MDRLYGLGVFVQVVEQHGFSAAARRLGVSPSAVSRQVAQLEDRLGTRLLNRTTRSVQPTEIGMMLYEKARDIVQSLDDAENSVISMGSQPRGRLRVSTPPTFGERVLAPLFANFQKTFPDIQLELVASSRRVDVVAEGFDVTIRVGEMPDSALIARRLLTQTWTIVAAPEYVEKRGVPKRPSDLTSHDCLTFSEVSQRLSWRFKGDQGDSDTPVTGPLQCNSLSMLRTATLAGLGIARLPTYVVGPDIKNGRLVELLTGHHVDAVPVYAVFPTAQQMSPKVRVFIDFMVDALAALDTEL
ncbi:MAG: LysR family transcriptional regulator [Alphaproteobacteria bacterium]|nr:LysR family transcriptional regulator [Alphaproteobacteria bacterium SS10]